MEAPGAYRVTLSRGSEPGLPASHSPNNAIPQKVCPVGEQNTGWKPMLCYIGLLDCRAISQSHPGSYRVHLE